MKGKKTKRMMAGVLSAIVTTGLSGCSSSALPPEPDDSRCADYEWDDEAGVYECDDPRSSYHGFYFFGGSMFRSKSALMKSSSYSSYKSSPSFKGGFGSGTRGGFGG